LILLYNFMEMITVTLEPSQKLNLDHMALFVEVRRRMRELISWFDKTHVVLLEGEQTTLSILSTIYQATQALAIRRGMMEWDRVQEEEEQPKSKKKTKAKAKASDLPPIDRAETFFTSLSLCYSDSNDTFWGTFKSLKKEPKITLIMQWEEVDLVWKSNGVKATGE